MKSFTLIKSLPFLSFLLLLVSCGGGGGGGGGNAGGPAYVISTSIPTVKSANYPSNWTSAGVNVTPPSVSPVVDTFNDGSLVTTQDGSSVKPFSQTTLASQAISDPNAYVASGTLTYNLIWGTPDKNGPGYASNFPVASTATKLSAPLGFMGIAVSGQSSITSAPTVTAPSSDVLNSWNAGWTGKGVNVLFIDGYSSINTCNMNSSNTCHGVVTMMTTNLAAPGAALFGLDASTIGTSFSGAAKNGNGGGNLTSPVIINAVNVSVTANAWCNNGCGITPSDASYAAMIASTANFNSAYVNALSGTSNISNLTNLGNAVITKSAGNDKLDSKYDVTTLALANNSNIASRLLIVGALDKNGSVSNPATIAYYSNYAGATTGIANRFVVANGNAPYAAGGVGINGHSAPGGEMGTSFSAPLVAGYAAVVMQKFPNLDAVKTSSIILDTARYDTLSCNPNCSPSIYGAGEASLSRALAPVGRLR